jgi:hypothetical protein
LINNKKTFIMKVELKLTIKVNVEELIRLTENIKKVLAILSKYLFYVKIIHYLLKEVVFIL